MKNLKLSPLETKIVKILATFGEMPVGEIAEMVFYKTPHHYLPNNRNNSVVSAIRQINRKRKGTIKGVNRGRSGKLVSLSKPALKHFSA